MDSVLSPDPSPAATVATVDRRILLAEGTNSKTTGPLIPADDVRMHHRFNWQSAVLPGCYP